MSSYAQCSHYPIILIFDTKSWQGIISRMHDSKCWGTVLAREFSIVRWFPTFAEAIGILVFEEVMSSSLQHAAVQLGEGEEEIAGGLVIARPY